MNREPFVNLFDIAGILMLVLPQAIFLALLGSKCIGWSFVGLIGILFVTAIFFAKRGTPK